MEDKQKKNKPLKEFTGPIKIVNGSIVYDNTAEFKKKLNQFKKDNEMV
jgi:hypothetical protein